MQQPPKQEAVGSAENLLHLEDEKHRVGEGKNAINIRGIRKRPESSDSKDKEEQPHAPLGNLLRPHHRITLLRQILTVHADSPKYDNPAAIWELRAAW
jgi:hypothetical protein